MPPRIAPTTSRMREFLVAFFWYLVPLCSTQYIEVSHTARLIQHDEY